MKKFNLLFLLSMLLTGCGANNISSTTSSPQSASTTSSTSQEVDYGTVSFNDIEIYPDGYDGTKIRPYFSNPEVEGLVEFTYTVDNENVCYIDEENKIRFVSAGTTKVTATSDIYGEKYFYVDALNSMTPDWMFTTAKNMTRSVLNNYEEGDSLFVGDSFFQFWREGTDGKQPVKSFAKVFEEYKVFNIGISASTTHDWRAMNDNTVALTSPKNIIINIGVNNVDDDKEVGLTCYKNVKSLVDDYLEMFEETNIYYLSITRCTGVFASKWNDHSFSNMMMEKYCASNDRLHYLDVNALYGETPGSFQSDGLHPNQAGYDLFEQIIKENVEFDEK